MGLIGNKEESLNNAVDRLLNPRTEEHEEVGEAESPELEEAVEASVEADNEEEVIEEVEESTEESGEVIEEDDDTEVVDEEPQDDETYYTVKVDGEELEVNLTELQDGYQRNKDYTQKTQSLAEERKSLEATKAELEAQRTQYIEVNKQLLRQEAAALQKYENLDWSTLAKEDPIEYTTKQAEYTEAKRQAQLRVAGIQQAMNQEQELATQRMGQYLEQQQQVLLQRLPEAAKPEFKEELTNYALSTGYTEEDLSQLVRANDLIILHKAKMFDDLQAKKAKVKEKKGPAKPKARVKTKAPAGKTTKKARMVKQQRDTLRKSGSIKDAAALLLNN